MKLFQSQIRTLIMDQLPIGEMIPGYRSSFEISIRYCYLLLKDSYLCWTALEGKGHRKQVNTKKKKKKDISCNIYMFGRGRGDEEQARAP